MAAKAEIGEKSLSRTLVAQSQSLCTGGGDPLYAPEVVLALVSEWDRVDVIVLVWYLGWPTHFIPHRLP